MHPEGLEPPTHWFEANCSNPTELRVHINKVKYRNRFIANK